MKKLLILIIIMILFQCCKSSDLPEVYYKCGLVDFAKDVSNNPEKLNNLKEIYPQFYSDSIVHYDFTTRSNLKNLINNINNKFNNVDEKIRYENVGFYEVDLQLMNKFEGTSYYFPDSTLYAFGLYKIKSHVSLNFYFIKIGPNSYKLFNIEYNHIIKED